jgi:hypothetical protein
MDNAIKLLQETERKKERQIKSSYTGIKPHSRLIGRTAGGMVLQNLLIY